MKKTMLTYKTLNRFEKLINPETLTAEQVQEVEHLAYCANMGADSEKSAWARFCELVKHFLNLDIIDSTPEEEEEEETTKRTAEEVTADIIEFFENNEDIYNEAIEELDGYNGYLGDDRYFSMDELDELHNGTEPSELLRRAFFGHDEETYTTDRNGNKTYGAFNPNRDYFRYNGYGNLVSTDYKDYSGQLDKYAVESMSENRRYIDSIEQSDELAALFDELEEVEE